LHRGGDLARAAALHREILKLDPRHADSLLLLGLIAAQSNDPKKAVVLIGKSLRIDPHNAVASFNLGSALQQLGRWQDALRHYDEAIATSPGFFEAHLGRGHVLQELDRLDEALASYDRGIAINPNEGAAWLSRGNLLARQRRWEGASASYSRAIRIDPRSAVAYCNRGNVLKELNRLDEAVGSFDRAIAMEPDYAVAYTNRAVALLLAGELERGWRDFEWRRKIPGISNAIPKKAAAGAPWLGQESLEGKTLLLHAEQGFGDTLQFCRYVPILARMGATVLLNVQKPLAGLLKGLPGVSRIAGPAIAPGNIDYQCPLMSLPFAVKTSLDTIPSSARYLDSSPDKVAQWLARLGTGSTRRIGLVWSGGTQHLNDHRRVPFADLIRHLPPGVDYVSLQREFHPTDEQSLRAHPDVMNVSAELEDFSDTAALCDCMDLVISVDTAVAHLSGALGRRTWILLPFSPDWRWLLDRVDSPWYPSATLYRQETPTDWSSVLTRLGMDLRAYLDLPAPVSIT
jgi:Tfp pilus assembly protein PilF